MIALSFVLPGLLGSKSGSAHPAGVASGAGLPAGSSVPDFTRTDLLTGNTITSASVFDHKTLLFFSEGVMCQACLQQIQGLQQVGSQLAQKNIQLVSITPDSPNLLRQAAQEYKINTPLISDTSTAMSKAFNTLGKGMHSTSPGHAFALIYHGKVLWYHDYWVTDGSMYVQPASLLSALPA